MERLDIERSNNYLDAKKKVEELKGFYIHLAIYLGVSTFITIFKIVRNIHEGETFNEAFFDFGTYAIWLFWGIGIFFHAFGVFGKNVFFKKDWEERKIKKYMEKEELEYKDKYE